MTDLLNFYKKIIDNKKNVFVLIVIQVFISLLYEAIPLYTQFFIDHVVKSTSFTLLLTTVIVLIVNMSSLELLQYYFNIIHVRVNMQISFTLDNLVFSKIMHAKVKFLTEQPASFIANRIKTDVANIMDYFDYFSNRMIANIVSALWMFVYAFSVDWRIAVFMIFSSIPIFLFYNRYYKKHKGKILAIRDVSAEVETFRYETLAGLKVLKMFLSCMHRLNIYKKRYDRYLKENVEVSVVENNPSIVEEVFMEFIPLVLVFLVGGYFVFKGDITLGQWIALNMYSGQFIRPFNHFARIGGKIAILRGTVSRLNEYLDLPCETSVCTNKPPKSFESISLKNIQFTYPDGTKVLNDINLDMHKENVYAIMGESGSGKSTLSGIISGFLEPDSGTYLINDLFADSIPLEEIRSKITSVSISDFIFSETIKDNIVLSNPDISDQEIEKAITMAAAKVFIDETDEKLETLLGEDGLGLSDGQKQRIILSRLFIKNGDIIIIDEATSSLDSETERIVLKNIIDQYSSKIIIFITHHPSVASLADEVVLIKNGSIVNIGSHEQLIISDEYYQKMIHRGNFNE